MHLPICLEGEEGTRGSSWQFGAGKEALPGKKTVFWAAVPLSADLTHQDLRMGRPIILLLFPLLFLRIFLPISHADKEKGKDRQGLLIWPGQQQKGNCLLFPCPQCINLFFFSSRKISLFMWVSERDSLASFRRREKLLSSFILCGFPVGSFSIVIEQKGKKGKGG